MRVFVRCLGAEMLKLKRSSVWLLSLLAPYVVTLFFALFAYFDGERFLSNESAWTWLGDSSFVFFSLIVLPMWAALVTAQVAAIEHRAQSFKHLFALPVKRSTLYQAKQSLCWLLAGGVFLWQVGAIVLAGFLLRWGRPGLGFESPVPWSRFLAFAGGGFLASLFLVAIHTWLALDRRDLVTPIATGFLATVSALALAGLDADLVVYHPWAYASEVVGALVSGEAAWPWMAAGAVGGALFAVVAGWSFVRRDVL